MRKWQNKSQDRCAKRGTSYQSSIKKSVLKRSLSQDFKFVLLTVLISLSLYSLHDVLVSLHHHFGVSPHLTTTNLSFQNRSLSNTSTLRFKRKQNHKVRGLQFFTFLVFRVYNICRIPLNANPLTGLPLSHIQYCFSRDPYPIPLEFLAP